MLEWAEEATTTANDGDVDDKGGPDLVQDCYCIQLRLAPPGPRARAAKCTCDGDEVEEIRAGGRQNDVRMPAPYVMQFFITKK